MGDLSAHFSRWEFKDHRTGELVGPDPLLLELLERIREHHGRPVRITSGYRSSSTNAAVGGVRRSQHLLGRAADLQSGVVTWRQALVLGATGVGRRGQWATHVDVREVAKPVTWSY